MSDEGLIVRLRKRAEIRRKIRSEGDRIARDLTEAANVIEILRDALEYECGGRCNAEYNPCNARDVLNNLQDKL